MSNDDFVSVYEHYLPLDKSELLMLGDEWYSDPIGLWLPYSPRRDAKQFDLILYRRPTTFMLHTNTPLQPGDEWYSDSTQSWRPWVPQEYAVQYHTHMYRRVPQQAQETPTILRWSDCLHKRLEGASACPVCAAFGRTSRPA